MEVRRKLFERERLPDMIEPLYVCGRCRRVVGARPAPCTDCGADAPLVAVKVRPNDLSLIALTFANGWKVRIHDDAELADDVVISLEDISPCS